MESSENNLPSNSKCDRPTPLKVDGRSIREIATDQRTEQRPSFTADFQGRFAPEEEVAALIGVQIATLRAWASRRRGPPGRKRLGNKIFYDREIFLEWAASR